MSSDRQCQADTVFLVLAQFLHSTTRYLNRDFMPQKYYRALQQGMIGLTRPRQKKIKGIYCSLIGSYGFIQSLSQTKSDNQQNNEGSRMRVIFEKGTPSAHINKNMHLECLSQNTEKLQTSVQEICHGDQNQIWLIDCITSI